MVFTIFAPNKQLLVSGSWEAIVKQNNRNPRGYPNNGDDTALLALQSFLCLGGRVAYCQTQGDNSEQVQSNAFCINAEYTVSVQKRGFVNFKTPEGKFEAIIIKLSSNHSSSLLLQGKAKMQET